MPITMTPIKASGKSRVPLDEIPEDVSQAVEDAYLFCADNDERLEAKFDSQDEAETFLHQARSYAYQRPKGRVVVSGNPTLKGMARFRVTAYVAPVETDPAVTNGSEPPAG